MYNRVFGVRGGVQPACRVLLRDQLGYPGFNDWTAAGSHSLSLTPAGIDSDYVTSFMCQARRSDGAYIAQPKNTYGMSHIREKVLTTPGHT